MAGESMSAKNRGNIQTRTNGIGKHRPDVLSYDGRRIAVCYQAEKLQVHAPVELHTVSLVNVGFKWIG
jgi:hypothetical protein